MCVMCVLVRMDGAIRMPVLVRMFVLVIVHMRMIVGVSVLMLVLMIGGRDHINLGPSQTGTGDFAHLEASAHIQRCGSLFDQRERNARVNERTEQHVAADAGKALKISDSHGSRCNYAPRRMRTSAGSTAFKEPERKPVQSRVTYWKPAFRNSAEIRSIISVVNARGNSEREISIRASSP